MLHIEYVASVDRKKLSTSEHSGWKRYTSVKVAYSLF